MRTQDTDPRNDPANEDLSEVEVCRHCRELIEPGTEIDWNGWYWHSNCVPSYVLCGLELEARRDERGGK